MWTFKQLSKWAFRSKVTKLEREIAFYQRYVKRKLEQMEQNRKKLEKLQREAEARKNRLQDRMG